MRTDTEVLYCIGVVLAGGQSTRMGRDKAMLSWRGRPLLAHQLATLRAAGVDAVEVSGHRPEYRGIGDASAQAGPLGGLAGIAAAHADRDVQLLVIPVDMPLLRASLLRRLRSAQPQAPCLRFAGRVLPLRLRLDARSRKVLDELLRCDVAHRRSLHALQRIMGAEEIGLRGVEASQLTDCNTEAVWNEVSA